VPLLRSLAGDADAGVRAEVAGALGAVEDDGARAELVGLVADPDATVAILALASLRKQRLVAGDWRRLAETARAARTAPSSDAELVRLVRGNLIAAGPEGRAILTALAERNVGPDNDLSRVIGELLAAR
jgi:HEAT repeat protein